MTHITHVIHIYNVNTTYNIDTYKTHTAAGKYFEIIYIFYPNFFCQKKVLMM